MVRSPSPRMRKSRLTLVRRPVRERLPDRVLAMDRMSARRESSFISLRAPPVYRSRGVVMLQRRPALARRSWSPHVDGHREESDSRNVVLLRKRPVLSSLRSGVPGVRRPRVLLGMKRRGVRQKPPPEPETKLEVSSIHCGGVVGPIGKSMAGWNLVLDDPYRRSFVSFSKRVFARPLLQEWMGELERNIRWSRPLVGARRLPRSAAWLTYGDCKCTYKYGGTSWPAMPMDDWFLRITDAVCHACGLKERPNSCNANFYEDGSQMVGYHSDDEPLFNAIRQDSLILSLSLGATRLFELRPDDALDEVTQLKLDDGDLCTMEGLFQKHYKHRVPPEGRVSGPRINLTWRWVVAHDADCPLHSKRYTASAPTGEALHITGTDRQSAHAAVARQAVRTIDDSEPVIISVQLSPEEEAKREKRRLRFLESAHVEAKPVLGNAAKEFSAPSRVVERSTPAAASQCSDETRKRRAEKFALPLERPQKVAKIIDIAAPALDSKASAACGSAQSGPKLLPSDDTERQQKRLDRFNEGKLSDTELGKRSIRVELAVPNGNVQPASDEAERRRQREKRFADLANNAGNREIAGSADLTSSSAQKVADSRAPSGLRSEGQFAESRCAKPQSSSEVATVAKKDSATGTRDLSKMSEDEKRQLRAKRFSQ